MFEVIFKYHAKNEAGKYDSSETLEFSKKLGRSKEEFPINKLAGFIMSQLARRDIWIIDLEVFEFAKRKILFKESKNGIILKNKKYSLAGDLSFEELDCEPEVGCDVNYPVVPSLIPPQPTNLMLHALQPNSQQVVPQVSSNPIRYELFKPEAQLYDTWIKNKGKGFTMGQRYGILEEMEPESDGRGSWNQFYKVVDDFKCVRKMDGIYFVQITNSMVE